MMDLSLNEKNKSSVCGCAQTQGDVGSLWELLGSDLSMFSQYKEAPSNF